MTTPLRPVILAFMRYYLPGFKSGGPARTLSTMIDELSDEFEFRVVASDRDLNDIHSYKGVETERWTKVCKASVLYLNASKSDRMTLERIVADTNHSAVYLNSAFDREFSIRVMLAQKAVGRVSPVIVAPRGEFAPSALSIKGIRKRLFLKLIGPRLYRDVFWHAASREEAEQIEALFGTGERIAVAPDMARPGEMPLVAPFGEGPLRVVFLSRIAKIKNLEFVGQVLRGTDMPIELDIWGPIEDRSYWDRCRSVLALCPKRVTVSYRGVVDHERVGATLAEYDLFFLPSGGESFGHAIAESLSAGTPVLISDRTPWRQLAEAGVGWDLPLDQGPEVFRRGLIAAREMRDKRGQNWREVIRSYAVSKLLDPAIVEANRRVFRGALQGN